MMRAFPQMTLAIAWGYIVKTQWLKTPFEVPLSFWTPLFSVTIYLGVFRTNNSFHDYKEGPKLLGTLVNSLTAAVRLAQALKASNRKTGKNLCKHG